MAYVIVGEGGRGNEGGKSAKGMQKAKKKGKKCAWMLRYKLGIIWGE